MKKSQKNLAFWSQAEREKKNYTETTVKLEEILVGIWFLSVQLLKGNKKNPTNAVSIHACPDPLFYYYFIYY